MDIAVALGWNVSLSAARVDQINQMPPIIASIGKHDVTLYDGGWDHHYRNFQIMQDRHAMWLDQAMSTFLADLKERGLLQSTLTRAVVFSAMTNAVAFGSMWVSSYPGMSSMGKMMALALLCTMAAAVLFQPVLMGPPRQAKASSEPADDFVPDAAK